MVGTWQPEEREEALMGEEVADERKKQTIETPSPSRITQAQFLSWKHQKDIDASARRAEAATKRAEDIAAGTVLMNGRELFTHEPWVFDNTQY